MIAFSLFTLLACSNDIDPTKSNSGPQSMVQSMVQSTTSTKSTKVPFMTAMTIAEGCCSSGNGSWSSMDERCVAGDQRAIIACIGEFTMVRSNGKEMKVTGRDFIR